MRRASFAALCNAFKIISVLNSDGLVDSFFMDAFPIGDSDFLVAITYHALALFPFRAFCSPSISFTAAITALSS